MVLTVQPHAEQRQSSRVTFPISIRGLIHERHPPIDLTPDEEEAMPRGIASIKSANGIRLDELRAILHRL